MTDRRERVVVEAVDRYTGELAKMAVATRLFREELDRSNKGQASFRSTSRQMESDAKRTSAEIDKLSGRMRLLADAAVTLGPGLIPVGAVGIAGVAGLASQLGFAAVGAASLAIASQGVGDALKAVNDAALEPTAANLEKARQAMALLAPEAQAFVTRFQELRPALRDIRDQAAAGWFPGLTEALDDFERVAPKIGDIMRAVGEVGGSLVAEGASALAGPQWADFLTFIEGEAPSALEDLGRTVGNVAHGLAELWMAFDPINDNFSNFLLDAARGFDEWATGLSETKGFQEFLAYVNENGPRVADAGIAVADAFLEIVEAAAPFGGPVLKGLTAVANILGAIADSDLGTPIFGAIAALSAYNRILAVTARLQGSALAGSAGGGLLSGFVGGRTGAVKSSLNAVKSDIGSIGAVMATSGARTARESARMSSSVKSLRGNLGGLATSASRVAGPLAAVGVAASGAADEIGLTNTISLALAGSMAGPWGAALGAGAGALMDLNEAARPTEDAIKRVNAAVTSADLGKVGADLKKLRAVVKDEANSTSVGDWFSDNLKGTIDPSVGRRAQEALDANGFAREVSKMDAAMRAAAGGFELTDAAAKEAAGGVDGFRAALARANSALTGRATLRDYQASLDDFSASVKENGRTLDINTAAGRNNQAALDNIANTAIRAAADMEPLAGQRYLQGAREDFINARMAIGGTRDEAAALADKLGLVDRMVVTPEIAANTDPAKLKADQVMAYIRGLKALITTSGNTVPFRRKNESAVDYANRLRAWITVDANTGPARDAIAALNGIRVSVIAGAVVGMTGSADGSTVPKTGLPYADRHLYLLADGEEVISNRHGQADRHRALLKAINAGAYAGGGTIGRSTAATMTAPSVTVGGAVVSVFIDGNEVRAIVREENRSDRDLQSALDWGKVS